jgi:hypothetical protein
MRITAGEVKLSEETETAAAVQRNSDLTIAANQPQMTRARLRGF